MPSLEHNFVIKYNEDGTDQWLHSHEPYLLDVALFLILDPDRGLLFEKRTRPTDPLFGQTIIPGGKIENPGERLFPLWAATNECHEETNTVWYTVVCLSALFDRQRRIMLYPFLMTGDCFGTLENQEPDKKELVWQPLSEVYPAHLGPEGVNPIFHVSTTRQILLDARNKMKQFGIND